MRRSILAALVMLPFICACAARQDLRLRDEILKDTRFDDVYELAYKVLGTGFNAGDKYSAVWIRDFNTFITHAMDVVPRQQIKEALNLFMCFQGEDGNVPDGYTPITGSMQANGYNLGTSPFAPGYGSHKNTVETDQESSFVQAVAKYVTKSGDIDYLDEQVAGKPVKARLEDALNYLRYHKSSRAYGGLITGATTVDWGDVQPEHEWGVFIDENTHFAIDVYDNVMYILAIKEFIRIIDDKDKQAEWTAEYEKITALVRKYLWDAGRNKFKPHIYLDGSPFPADFNEDEIFYQGGTGIAACAGVLTPEEIRISFEKMCAIRDTTGAASICVTAYPPYPEGFFKNPMMKPYGYQNGGDWSWYGVRIFWAMIDCGMVREAYTEFGPVLDRVIANQGFNEWYDITGKAMGSGTYRGEAGVILETIDRLRSWAEN